MLLSSVKVLTSLLTFYYKIFDDNNIVKAATIVIVSKGTLAARHRPGAAADYARDYLSQNRVTAKSSLSLLPRAPSD